MEKTVPEIILLIKTMKIRELTSNPAFLNRNVSNSKIYAFMIGTIINCTNILVHFWFDEKFHQFTWVSWSPATTVFSSKSRAFALRASAIFLRLSSYFLSASPFSLSILMTKLRMLEFPSYPGITSMAASLTFFSWALISFVIRLSSSACLW